MNQTGVCGTSWPRQARTKGESFKTEVTAPSCHDTRGAPIGYGQRVAA
jgi:hypothetical protein